MALGTVTVVKRGVLGDLRLAIVDVQPTSGANYTTGGEPFAAAQVGFLSGQLLAVIPVGGGQHPTNKPVPHWDAVNKKLMIFRQAAAADVGLTEAASSTDFSGAANSVRLLCLGK